jgi:hypothetical protein
MSENDEKNRTDVALGKSVPAGDPARRHGVLGHDKEMNYLRFQPD